MNGYDNTIAYFYFWSILKYYKNDLSEDENQRWENFSDKKKKTIIKRVRVKKIKRLQEEIKSEEIKKICEESEIKKYDRDNFLDLLDLLIKEIEKPQ